MASDRVWVSVERTVNLGNYQNIKLSAGLSMDVGDTQDDLELVDSLLDKYEALIGKHADEYEEE